LDVSALKDKTVNISSLKNAQLNLLKELVRSVNSHSKRIELINREILSWISSLQNNSIIEKALDLIFASHGMLPVTEVSNVCEVSERQLERLFTTYIGLSPNFMHA
jgi:transcriptional regulator GlxA family with amidase domain